MNTSEPNTIEQDLQWEAFANAIEEWLDAEDPSDFPDTLSARPSGSLPAHMVQRMSMLNGQISIVLGELRAQQHGISNSLRAIRQASPMGQAPSQATYLDMGA